MKAFALAVLVALAALTGAKAETFVSDFHPRFGTFPANPDNPDWRPPDRPRNSYDFSLGVELFEDDWQDCRGRHCDGDRGRDRRRHHHRD